jgi:hypothetical protein
MQETHQLAQLLTSCWRISGGTRRIPTLHGVLDRALKSVCEEGGFPDWARKQLHFADSRIGLRCVELPAILEWAQRAQLTSAPNPSYETSEVQISERLAERLLDRLGVSPDDGRRWGQQLRSAIEDADAALSEFEYARVEEY